MIINKGEDGARSPGADMDDLRLAFPPGAEPPFRTPVSVLVATAARRGRRRRIATLSAKAALFAVPVIAAVVVFANFSTGTVTPAVRPASSPSAAPSPPAAVCTGAQLSGKVSRAGSQSSAPFAEIVLTNGGPGSCQLSGYPQLTAWGPTGHGPSAPLKTALTRGSTYEIPDAGPTTVSSSRAGPRGSPSAPAPGTDRRSSCSTQWSSTSAPRQAGRPAKSMSPSAWTRVRRRERQSRSPSPPLRPESPRSRDALSRPQPFSPNSWPLRHAGVGLAPKHAIGPPTEHQQVPGARSEPRPAGVGLPEP